MLRCLFIALVVACGLAAGADASELRVEPGTGLTNLWSRADVLRDPGGTWTFADVEGRTFSPAAALRADPASNAFAPSVLWFRLQLRPGTNGTWFLRTGFSVDRADVYARDGAAVAHASSGMRVPYAQRSVRSIEPLVRVPDAALHGGTLYVRTVSAVDRFGTFELRPEAWLNGPAHDREESSLAPLLLTSGMIVALALMNCILAATLRDRIYVWYAAAMFAFVGYDTVQTGIAWRFVWPQLSVSYDVTMYALMGAFFCLAVGFSRVFLDLPHTAPLLWRVVAGALAFVVMEEVAYAVWPNAIASLGWYATLDPLATTLLLIAVFSAGVAAWRRGNRLARFYCLAFAGVVIGLTINTCGAYGLIQQTPFTLAANGIGVAWEAVFLSAALADRLRGLNVRAEALQGERDALEVVAFRDALTGVANRGAFELRLAEEWRRGARTRSKLALIILDVDHFKLYNDALGHPRGDRVLARVARAIAAGMRRPEDLIARYGGEEFVIVLPNCSRDDAARIADEMRSRVRRMNIVHPTSEFGYVTVSAGVAAVVPRHEARPVALISAADKALYSAKRGGRDRIALARFAPRWYA